MHSSCCWFCTQRPAQWFVIEDKHRYWLVVCQRCMPLVYQPHEQAYIVPATIKWKAFMKDHSNERHFT